MERASVGDGNGNGGEVVEVEVPALGDGEGGGGCGEGWRNSKGEEGGVSRAHTFDGDECKTQTRKREGHKAGAGEGEGAAEEAGRRFAIVTAIHSNYEYRHHFGVMYT